MGFVHTPSQERIAECFMQRSVHCNRSRTNRRSFDLTRGNTQQNTNLTRPAVIAGELSITCPETASTGNRPSTNGPSVCPNAITQSVAVISRPRWVECGHVGQQVRRNEPPAMLEEKGGHDKEVLRRQTVQRNKGHGDNFRCRSRSAPAQSTITLRQLTVHGGRHCPSSTSVTRSETAQNRKARIAPEWRNQEMP